MLTLNHAAILASMKYMCCMWTAIIPPGSCGRFRVISN